MLNSGHGDDGSDISARGRVLNNSHGGYSSDMSGRVCLTIVMVDTALT